MPKLRVIAILAIGLTLGACSGSNDDTVGMQSGQRFEPETLTISVGTTVTFVNESDEAHTVTAYEDELGEGGSYFASGGFETEKAAREDTAGGLLSAGEEFEVRLDAPGTYEYFCIPHESAGMTGRILVEE